MVVPTLPSGPIESSAKSSGCPTVHVSTLWLFPAGSTPSQHVGSHIFLLAPWQPSDLFLFSLSPSIFFYFILFLIKSSRAELGYF